jgi:4-carboxymuconolactone decarboxylase
MTATGTRIEPLASDDATAQKSTVGSDRNSGRPLNIFLTLAKNPPLFDVFTRFGSHLLFKGELPAREREVVILRVGWQSQSEYEFGQHTVIGKQAGLTDDEVTRLARTGTDGWNDDDAALLRMVDELCADNVVGDDTWRTLSKAWTEPQLLELLMLAGYYRLVSGVLNSAGVSLEPATPGWPDGTDDVRRAPRDGAPTEGAQ